MLADCLNSLRFQTFRDFEVILVDNGSVDDSVDFVRAAYPEVKLMRRTTNTGFAAANNYAICRTRSTYVALLNNDASAAEGWLAGMVRALETHADAGMAASRMLFRQYPQIIDRAGDAYTLVGAGQLRGRGASADTYRQYEWIFGACAGAALYRRSMLDHIGLFDEDFFLLYEDVDLSLRACLQGYGCIYVPDAIVYHQASLSIGRDSRTSVYYGHRNLEWAWLQNLPASILALTLLPHLFYTLAAFLYFWRMGQGRVFLRAKADAIKGLPRALAKRRRVQSSRRITPARVWKLMTFESVRARRRGHVAVGGL